MHVYDLPKLYSLRTLVVQLVRASGTSYVSESYRGLIGMRIYESQWNFSRESGTLELELLRYEPEVLVSVDWNELLRVVSTTRKASLA